MGLGTLFLLVLSSAAALVLVDGNNEGDVLFNWKSMLNDSENVLHSWDATLVNPCTWFHVTCNSNNYVTRLDLGNAGLSGAVSPLLGNLTSLEYLELYGNSFTGEIPAEIGKLRSLVSLDLSHNQFSGSIPPEFSNLESLRFLELFDNNLTGVIPLEIGKLTNLERLGLYNNQISGSIPATLGNLKSLKFLMLNGNALTGDIPAEVLGLVRWGNLQILNVSENSLTGRVPSKIPRGFATTTIVQDRRA